MVMNTKKTFNRSAICLALGSALALPAYSFAEAAPEQEKISGIERIEVTASRRASSVQEAPLNITALDGDVMKDQNITQLSDVARWVPGLTVPDQGGRSGSPIIVRGLNTTTSGPDSDAGTVATYIGESPLTVDMKLIDLERVEVLIGPQGTLYGAGTLGGAIRYIPNKPILDETSGSLYGDIFSISASAGTGGEAGFVFNKPLINDTLAMRVAFNYLDEPGYIDYNYVLREGGVSLPDPDWTNASEVNSNLKRVKDANSEKTTTAKVMLRWTPNDIFDATLAYFYQKQEIGGRSIVHHNSLSADNGLAEVIGKYESAYRFEEPRDKKDSLLSLELTADLGFAELTSATGYSEFEADGQRDQTDLLIRLDYSYEEFPAFSAFTREVDDAESLTQEIRLVSSGDSALSWIAGLYYSNYQSNGSSKEFTPGFGEYAVAAWGADQSRPDALEYYSVDDNDITEKAIFGELTYQASDELTFTLGGRFYKYDMDIASAVDLPLLHTLWDGASPTEINLNYQDSDAKGDGNLVKFNVSYQFNDDVMGYATVSEGFRIGGSNGIPACDPDKVGEQQNICTMPDEVLFEPDTTTNYELGFKSTWFNNQLHFNAAVFLVEWDNAQISTQTVIGQQPITGNAGKAEAKGVEISARAMLSDSLIGYATYAYTNAELTENAPNVFGSELHAFAGDRLPGSAEHQFSMGLTYSTEIFNDKALDVNYGLTYQSDVYSTIGLHVDGETLPGYALSNLSAKISDEKWSVTFYIDNMFDKYAFTSVRRNVGDITTANAPQLSRNYGHFLTTPQTVGMRFEYMFDL